MAKKIRSSYLVFLATYNEADNIEHLLNEIWEHASNVDILVVDDNSPDGTSNLLDKIALKEPRLKAIRRPRMIPVRSSCAVPKSPLRIRSERFMFVIHRRYRANV